MNCKGEQLLKNFLYHKGSYKTKTKFRQVLGKENKLTVTGNPIPGQEYIVQVYRVLKGKQWNFCYDIHLNKKGTLWVKKQCVRNPELKLALEDIFMRKSTMYI